jgi:hypothetical protein
MPLRELALHRPERRPLLRTERFDRLRDARQQRLRHRAAVTHGLTADQVVRLDRGGAFIDRQNARVAVVLSRARFFDEAHAAMHLHAEARDIG